MPIDSSVFRPLLDEISAKAAVIGAATGADAVAMWVYDAASKQFDLPIHWQLFDPESFSDLRNRPAGDGFAARILLKGEIVLVSEHTENERRNIPFVLREQVQSYAAVPIWTDNNPVGVMFLNFRSRKEFPPEAAPLYSAHASDLADLIIRSNVLSESVRPGVPHHVTREDALAAIMNTVCDKLQKPGVLWLFDPLRERRLLKVSAGRKVPTEYTRLELDITRDRSIVTDVVTSGKQRLVSDVSKEPYAKYVEFARAESWQSAAYCPVMYRGQCVGAFEIFYTDSGSERDVDFADLERHALIATVIIQNFERMREAEQVRNIAHDIAAKPDIRTAMEVIAEGARLLTSACSASILLFDKSGERCDFETHSPVEATFGTCRQDLVSLARSVIRSPENFLLASPGQIPGKLAETPCVYRSFIGISVPVEDEFVAMFGVFSKYRDQFSEHDAHLLRMIAGHVSVALGWVQRMLRPTKAVEEATARLARQDDELESLCDRVLALGYDYAAVQMIRPDERTIKSRVCRTKPGTLPDWSGPSGHYLTTDEKLQDIMAAIVLLAENRTQASIQVVNDWDSRFDEWIYERYKHCGLTRVFVPILVIRDENNQILDPTVWTDKCRWEPGEKTPNFKEGRGPTVGRPEDGPDGYCTKYGKLLPGEDVERYHFEVLGTVEAGYLRPDCEVTLEEVTALTELVTRGALPVRSTCVMHVFDTILKSAKSIVGADAASLHFKYKASIPDEPPSYQYECSDGLDWVTFHEVSPRPDGLGFRAIRLEKPMICPDQSKRQTEDDYKHYHYAMWEAGFRTTAAFPFVVDGDTGVLYLHFSQLHRIAPDEEGWISLFLNKVVDAIRQSTSYIQLTDTDDQLKRLNGVFQSLVRTPFAFSTLREIAWNTLNMRAADLVTIYEYQASERRMVGPPIWAGRPIEPEGMHGAGNTIPIKLIRRGKNVYSTNAKADNKLTNLARAQQRGRLPFVTREKIISSCGVLLKAGMETVGVMFVNYRRSHGFSSEEKELLEALASSAAIAIQNRRSMQALVDVGKNMVESPDLPAQLAFSLTLAVKATRAELGEVWVLNLTTGEMECRRCRALPGVKSPRPCERRVPLGSRPISNISTFPDKGAIPAPIDVSEIHAGQTSLTSAQTVLIVPLYDMDKRLVGAINLETSSAGAFREIDDTILDALAHHIVIAITNAHDRRTAGANAMLAVIGVAAPSFHRANNHAILIKDDAEIIHSNTVDDVIQTHARKIVLTAESIMEEAKNLGQFINVSTPREVDLCTIVEAAIDQVPIPAPVQLIHGVPKHAPLVMGTEFVLKHIFADLISNALRAMENTGQLTIAYRIAGTGERGQHVCGTVIVSVTDTGRGIRPNDVERVFERGYSTKSAKRGMGFGLWWARLSLRGLGGDLTVNSTPGQGATFNVVLPIAPEQ